MKYMLYQAFVWLVGGICTVIIVLLVLLTQAQAQEQRIVNIKGMISPDSTRVLLQDLTNALSSDTPVTIVINSPGGAMSADMTAVLALVDKNSGRVRCVVDQMAISLALVVFSHCRTRIVKPKAVIMWHSGRLILPAGMAISQYDAEDLTAHLTKLNLFLWAPLRAIIGDDDGFYAAMKQEYVWPIEQLLRLYPQFATIEP